MPNSLAKHKCKRPNKIIGEALYPKPFRQKEQVIALKILPEESRPKGS